MPDKVPRVDPPLGGERSSFRTSPLRHVRYLYTNFVQGFFYFLPKGSYHWELDPQESEIIIQAEAPIRTEVLGDRPGITFTRAPVGFFHLGFDDMEDYDFRTGKKTKGVLIPGTMIINVCSRNDLESEQLAFWVAEQLWLNREILQQQGFYDVGRNLKVGSPSPPGSIVAGDNANEWFCTSITSPYHFPRLGAVTPLNRPIARNLQLDLSVVRPAPIQQGIPVPGANGTIDPPFQQDALPPKEFAGGAHRNNLRTKENPFGLPLAPHPLNPSQLVVIRPARADQPGVRPPSIGGRVLPIQPSAVEESVATPVITTIVKV